MAKSTVVRAMGWSWGDNGESADEALAAGLKCYREKEKREPEIVKVRGNVKLEKDHGVEVVRVWNQLGNLFYIGVKNAD